MSDINSNLPTKDTSDGTPGSAVPAIAIQVAGSDGTNLRTIATDASGNAKIIGTGSAGTPATGVVSVQGVSGGTVVPVSGTLAVSNLPSTVDTNYGTVGASTLRTASEIGNAAGAAAFNSGTTSAQTLRAVLPTDQTGINAFLDKSGTGTISALNGVVTITTNGMSTMAISAQGTFVATLQVQGQAGDGAWDTVIGYLPGAGTTSTVLTGASMLVFPIGGFNQVRLIAIAYTSGTANIQYNLGAGTQGLQVFNLTPASFQAQVGGTGADGAAVVGNPVRVAGKDGSGNTQDILTDTSGNQAILLKDSSANGITSSASSGTTTNKQAVDINFINTASSRYFTAFTIQQSAATAVNSTVFTMRNAAASTKTVYIERMSAMMGFNPTNPVTRTQQTYVFQRFSAATPTGGTALTAAQGNSADAASQITDIRFLDTGLTTTGVTFVANNFTMMACDTTQGIFGFEELLTSPSAISLAPGEGIAIRLGVVAVTGQTLSCNLAWREQ